MSQRFPCRKDFIQWMERQCAKGIIRSIEEREEKSKEKSRDVDRKDEGDHSSKDDESTIHVVDSKQSMENEGTTEKCSDADDEADDDITVTAGSEPLNEFTKNLEVW